jgi:hypothetical protein
VKELDLAKDLPVRIFMGTRMSWKNMDLFLIAARLALWFME